MVPAAPEHYSACCLCVASVPLPLSMTQMQVQLSGTASELSSGILAEQLWAMPFRQRVDVCCRIFCQTEPVHKALHDHIGEGVCKPDGFALHITYAGRPACLPACLPACHMVLHAAIHWQVACAAYFSLTT